MITHPNTPCSCLDGKFHFIDFSIKYLGWDEEYGVSSILTCRRCGRQWLRYFYEHESYSKSGRWYCGILEIYLAETVDADNAKHLLETMEWYFRGGSFYSGDVTKSSGPIKLIP